MKNSEFRYNIREERLNKSKCSKVDDSISNDPLENAKKHFEEIFNRV